MCIRDSPNTVDNVADAIWEATDGEGADSVLEVTGEDVYKRQLHSSPWILLAL